MRFSNDNAAWSTWENYTAAKTWALTGSDGNKTVYAQFKDAAGLTASAYASIILDTTAPTVDAGSDRTVNLLDTVTFDGSASDANGIVSYKWLFGDGTSGTGASASNFYGSIGTFTAKLTATDAAGNTGSATVKVVVNFTPAATATPTPTAIPTPTTKPTVTPTPTPTATAAAATATPTQPPMMGAENSLWVTSLAVAVAFCLGAALVYVLMRLRSKPKP
jgi:hypothetical protein